MTTTHFTTERQSRKKTRYLSKSMKQLVLDKAIDIKRAEPLKLVARC